MVLREECSASVAPSGMMSKSFPIERARRPVAVDASCNDPLGIVRPRIRYILPFGVPARSSGYTRNGIINDRMLASVLFLRSWFVEL